MCKIMCLMICLIVTYSVALSSDTESDLRLDNVYMLYVPGLGEGGQPVQEVMWCLLDDKRLFGAWDYAFFVETCSAEDFRAGRLPEEGLKITEDGKNIKIEGMIWIGMSYYLIELEGQKLHPAYWEGESKVKIAPYFSLVDGVRECEWGLRIAPKELVYAQMLDQLNIMKKRDLRGLSITKERVLEYLKAIVSMDSMQRLKSRISRQFALLVIQEIENGRIVIKSGRFTLPDQQLFTWTDVQIIEKYFVLVNQEVRLPKEQIEIPYVPRYSAKENIYLPSRHTGDIDVKLKITAKESRYIWYLKSNLDWTKEYDDKYTYLDFTKKELRYVPGIVVLAEHLSEIPPEVAKKVSKNYITDDSVDWFSEISYKEMATIPSQIFLIASLPHMSEENARNLAETDRIKALLEPSDLDISDISELSMPDLTVQLLQNMDQKSLQTVLDLTPKFKEYLAELVKEDHEGIKEIVEKKKLNLSRDGDREKQLTQRLVEEVIPRMIIKLQMKMKVGVSLQDRVNSFRGDFVADMNGDTWSAIKAKWDDDEGLQKEVDSLLELLKKARDVSPEIQSKEKELKAVFVLDDDYGRLEFRYVPNSNYFKWQMVYCGK